MRVDISKNPHLWSLRAIILLIIIAILIGINFLIQ